MTRYLLLTNVVSGVVVDASGDFIVQRMIERSANPYDYPRTARMATVGVSLTVPDHYWYKYLDKRFPSRSARTITVKVVLDCAIMGPVNIVLFYLGMCKLEGHSWTESFSELKNKFLVTFMLDLVVWPAAQALNFYYVPPALRLMYLNGVYFVWSIILSYLKHNDTHRQTKINR